MLLPPTVVGAVLLGAGLHATWNVGIRAGADRRRETALLLGGAAAIAALALPFLPGAAAGAVPFLIASVLLHVLYFALVAEAYARGGVSLAYPLMRGTAPMLATLIAWGALGEDLPPLGWAGICAISAGVVTLARRRGERAERIAVLVALGNAVVIALYTVNDALGARTSGSPFAYALWIFLLTALPAIVWLNRGRGWRLPGPAEALRGFGGGACTTGAYALALWAMAHAAVAPVAALRETSMLFGIVLARLALGERPGWRGWAGAGLIAAGAGILRLA
jgi:drug/metabolite transporter (DMT)-like permease